MQSFTELDLSPELMRAVTELGYETPSPIQAQALPILLGGKTDFLGLAATGTGKTAAFGLPLLERVDPSKRAVQGLILCPTRELAVQVAGQIDLLGKFKGVRALPIYGGAPYGDQINGLKRGATIVVGTPGRLCDHLDKGTLSLKNLEVLILDEADEMISMGFKDDLEKILQACGQTEDDSEESQRTNDIWLFSATMSREVRHVADEYLHEPAQVQINKTEMLSGTVEQLYYITQESNKPEILCKLIEAAEDLYGLVFCQTKALVTDLTRYLAEKGYKVDCLHGDMDQKARDRTMQAFRDRKVSILVCTDVASRGLDVKDITHVFNYSIPRELDNYVHRIGRTGRSGKAGIAMSLVTPSHRVLIGRIEKMTKSRMTEGRVPTRKEIGAKKVESLLTKFQEQPNFARATELLGATWKETLSAMTSEEIASRFLMLTFPDLFNDKSKEASQERMGGYQERGDSRGGDLPGGRGGRSYGGGRDRDRGGDRGGYAGGYTSGGDRGPRNTDRGATSEYKPNPQIAGEHKFQILKMESKQIAASNPVSVKIPTARSEFKAEAKAEFKSEHKAEHKAKPVMKPAVSAKPSAQAKPAAHVAAPAKPTAKPHAPAAAVKTQHADKKPGSPWDQYKKGEKSPSAKKAKKRAWDKPLSK